MRCLTHLSPSGADDGAPPPKWTPAPSPITFPPRRVCQIPVFRRDHPKLQTISISQETGIRRTCRGEKMIEDTVGVCSGGGALSSASDGDERRDVRSTSFSPLRGESVCAWLSRLAIERCGPLRGESVCFWLARLAIERCGPLRGESVRAWLGRLAIKRYGRCVASQSALGWRDSLLSVAGRCVAIRAWLATVAIERCGRCVASQSALGWGDSLLSVAGRCPGELVRAWLARLSLCCESVRAWLATVAIEPCGRCVASQSALGWGDSLCGESVCAWLATVAIEHCGRCVASQSELGWGDSLLSVAGRCPGESVRAWLARLSLCGESVRAWLATVSIERCGRRVASQSALGWGDSLLSVAGRCPGESVRAWLARLSRSGGPLLGDVAGRCLASKFALGWRNSRYLALRAAVWRVSSCLVGETVAAWRAAAWREAQGKSFVVGLARVKGWRDGSCELAR
ncbi:hypothetical protein ACLB2K_041478 [Fragaria x ananassa]